VRFPLIFEINNKNPERRFLSFLLMLGGFLFHPLFLPLSILSVKFDFGVHWRDNGVMKIDFSFFFFDFTIFTGNMKKARHFFVTEFQNS
jgi:hypothetical protein